MSHLLSNLKEIYIASDHAGYGLKQELIPYLRDLSPSLRLHDLGPNSENSVDYPDYAALVCRKVIESHQMGLLICGTGQGMAMAANRFSEIRAALCWTPEIAEIARKHNNANVLCIGSRVLDPQLCKTITERFFTTTFEAGRHSMRVEKLSQIRS